MLPCAALFLILYDPKKRAHGSEGDFLGIISLGCVHENMWLAATSPHLGFQVMSSLSGGKAEKEMKHLLSIPERITIGISFRLGYSKTSSKYLI